MALRRRGPGLPDVIMSPVVLATFASLLAGLSTALGAMPIFLVRRISELVQDVILGFAAGVMLSACFFSLILPGLEAARGQGAGELGAVTVVGAGILLGAAALWLMHRYAPHEHFILGQEGPPAKLARGWLFVIAITLHNLPEGLAVGVGFAEDRANGTAIAVGIALQNMPEGLVVALALLTLGYSKASALAVATLTGLVEPVGAFVGASTVIAVAFLLPWGLAFAAGAMLFVVSNEIIPETHRRGLQTHATAGMMLGFVAMMFLDAVFG